MAPEYEVSDTGKVRKAGKLLNQYLKRNGYVTVAIRRVPRLVHRLVAQTFLGCVPGCPQVNHKNGVTNDNNLANLEWCDGFYNQWHRFNVLGKTRVNTTVHYSGVDHGLAKPLKFEGVSETLYFECAVNAAKHFGVKYRTSISNARRSSGSYRGYKISEISKEEYKNSLK